MSTSQHLLRFPATLDGFEHGGEALRELLNARDVEDRPRYNVELAFEEVVANIVRHGVPTGDVEVAIRFEEDEIVMTFEDDGVPFDPRDRPDLLLPTSIDEAAVGGLGIVMLRNIVTRMVYERKHQRNVLTLTVPAR